MWGKSAAADERSLRKFANDDSGAGAVEFALVAGPFFFLVGCIVETGLMLFTEYTLQSSVQEAARLVRTGQAQESGFSTAQFKDKVCETASIVIDCSGGVTVYVRAAPNFAALKTALPSYLNVGLKDDGTPNPTSYSCGQPSEAVAVVATYDWDFAFPFMDFFGNVASGSKRRLAGFAMFKNEPFPTGTSCT